MKIIGFNLKSTHYGLPLDNGGACLIIDGDVKMVINEERLNRKQYSPGFKKSIEYILNSNNLTLDDIDLFVASSCLEQMVTTREVSNQLSSEGFVVHESKIKVCDHHLSHAFSTYYPSGFGKAIIMVLDGDGNNISSKMEDGTENDQKYWLNKNEHNSYFLGDGDNISLLERDSVSIGENGFGGAYRYFTYFCGFKGYKYAGKLMGLSAYGSKRNKFKDLKLFELGENGYVKCLLPDTDRINSSEVVENWFAEQGISVKSRGSEDGLTEQIEDVAFFVQKELDIALIHKVNYLVKKTGIKNLCIAGGVGLNAVSNRAILDNTEIENIFIQPAAGDGGQCLGNAFFGAWEADNKKVKRGNFTVYQGKEYSEEEIKTALIGAGEGIDFKRMEFADISKLAAQKISDDKIIGWFQGGSEIGPRALGNRSILANPANKDMKNIINMRVKHREVFRPFAPSVMEEKAEEWFDIDRPAPYMIINSQVKRPLEIPSVTHVDGSARIQTVNPEQNQKFYSLLNDLYKITKVPIVLNTSFNDNEAIVESPVDAVNTFLRTKIDFLFLGNYFVEKVGVKNEWSEIADKAPEIQSLKNKVLNPAVINLLKKYGRVGKAFDYGCGWGEFANEMSMFGFEVTAFDDSDEMVDQAKGKYPRVNFLYRNELEIENGSIKKTFDVVTSNLVLCILETDDQKKVLRDLSCLVKDDGLVLLSFCHPYYDFLSESLVTKRVVPADAQYYNVFKFEKIIRENGIGFSDYHRPMEHYLSLLGEFGFEVLDTRNSDTLGSNYEPDFIIFALKKKDQ